MRNIPCIIAICLALPWQQHAIAAGKNATTETEPELPPLAVCVTTLSAAFDSAENIQTYLGKPASQLTKKVANKQVKGQADKVHTFTWPDAEAVLFESGGEPYKHPIGIKLRRDPKGFKPAISIGSPRKDVEKTIGKPKRKEGNQDSYRQTEGGIFLAVTYDDAGKGAEVLMAFDLEGMR
ncbi:MAG: hypothetical protein WCN98_20720 [Verrucomicrobiaceae bacterium]